MAVRSWAKYIDELLLGGRWLPVTGCVLFVNAPRERAVAELINGVRGQYVRREYGSPLRQRTVVADDLGALLSRLLPLDTGEPRRELFVQTADPQWTAVFDTSWRGQDPHSPMMWFAQGGIRSVSVSDFPHTMNSPGLPEMYGQRKIEMYEIVPNAAPVGYTLGVRVADSNRWEFDGGGRNFPMGSVWDPDAKRDPDKFTHEHLVQMCALLGLRPFDEDFYAPDNTGVIVERTEPNGPNRAAVTLAQARGEEPVFLYPGPGFVPAP
ncbi:hypothetical protein [Homoserinimonas hongtaonis]|nr:hypothetical protein [Salinibacterium hongtaonis]